MNKLIVFILLLSILACKEEPKKVTELVDTNSDTLVVNQDTEPPYADTLTTMPENINKELPEAAIAKQEPITKVGADGQVSVKVPKGMNIATGAPVLVKSGSIQAPPKAAEQQVVIPEPSQPLIQTPVVKAEEVKVEEVNISEGFNALLGRYVSSAGRVNYAGIKSNKSELDAVIKTLQDNAPKSSWSRNEQLAYWINVYNAFTIKKIVDNYPVSSITKLDGGKPWDVKWIAIGGKTYSLNNIENDIIRPTFKDARIHFAVNCAAKSCPPILNNAYTENNVNALLNSQTKNFINNTSFNKIEGSSISISKLFDWYKEDFGDIVSFLNKYASTEIQSGAKVTYQEYNWDLNN